MGIKCRHEDCDKTMTGTRDDAIERGWIFITGTAKFGRERRTTEIALCRDHVDHARQFLEADGFTIDRRVQE